MKEIKHRKEELRLKYIDIDPYGEEDWMNESSSNIWVECPLNHKFKEGEEIKLRKSSQFYYQAPEVIGKFIRRSITSYDWLKIDWGKGTVTPRMNSYQTIDLLITKFSKEESEKLKTEIRQRHLDVDPYGEEEWTD
jgi:hypothetical protein